MGSWLSPLHLLLHYSLAPQSFWLFSSVQAWVWQWPRWGRVSGRKWWGGYRAWSLHWYLHSSREKNKAKYQVLTSRLSLSDWADMLWSEDRSVPSFPSIDSWGKFTRVWGQGAVIVPGCVCVCVCVHKGMENVQDVTNSLFRKWSSHLIPSQLNLCECVDKIWKKWKRHDYLIFCCCFFST